MSPGAWAVIGAAAVALLALAAWMRARRQVIRRVSAVVARLDERPEGVEGGGGHLDAALSRLERTTDRTNTRLADARIDHERLSMALDGLEDGVVVVNASQRVVFTNRVGAGFVDARHGEAVAEAAVRDLLAEAVRGRASHRQLSLFGPPRRVLSVSGFPLEGGGSAGGAVAVIRDVSEARRVDSVRRDFVANVSHELKTPIGALVALAETLEGDDDPAVMRRLAQRVHQEADRLARIVDDLLDLSFIEAQEARERDIVAVRDLVGEAVDRVRGVFAQTGAHLDVPEIPEELTVHGDRRLLVSALFNLLDNAVKYLDPDDPGGGKVRVEVGSEDGWVVFRVCDDGIGIPEAHRDRIFERFYRVDRARSRATGGTGLGLSIVRHVAQAHGGGVSVESEEGVGSTFSLWIPATPGPSEPAEPPAIGERR